MATNFTAQATKTLSPAYTQQANALKAQLPAIEQLYQALGRNLQGQAKTDTQNAFEGAGGRGLLRSTIPVDMQTGIQQALLQKQSQLGFEQAQKIGGVQNDLAGVNVNMAQAIAQLSQALRGQDLAERQFGFTKKQSARELSLQRKLANRDYALQKRIADREYQLQKELAALGM